MKVQPYLFFNGSCEEALAFYQKALGAEVLMLLRFKENPDKPPRDKVPAELDDKVMHVSFKIGETEVMASDGMGAGKAEFKGISLALDARDEAEADRLFNALADGGQIQMPIGKTFFSPRFGVVADKFGVSWMVVAQEKP
jgi:PhnB protein